jgi:sulfur carrier protein ThiS
MTNTVDLHANMFLHTLFQERGWANPCQIPVAAEISALSLLAFLSIPKEQVGAVFVNGRAYSATEAVIRPGDRVAIFSPGAPMFVFLGFHDHSYSLAE